MPQFLIKVSVRNPIHDSGLVYILQQMLDDEWTIKCRLIKEINNPSYVSDICIERDNTSEEVSVSGEVIKTSTSIPPETFKKKFFKILEKGIKRVRILEYINQEIIPDLKYITGVVNIQPIGIESKENIRMKCLEQLSKDFEHILDPQSSFCTDVILKCGSTCIPAHKLILSARSRVFGAMFAHPTKENLTNEVNVSDIEVSVLQTMLMYMYTGRTPDLTEESAADLLVVADRYELLRLKEVCSHVLMETVCPESVLKILVLGDVYDENLKSFAANYICNKCDFSDLQNSEEWETLRKDLLDYLFSYMMKRN